MTENNIETVAASAVTIDREFLRDVFYKAFEIEDLYIDGYDDGSVVEIIATALETGVMPVKPPREPYTGKLEDLIGTISPASTPFMDGEGVRNMLLASLKLGAGKKR